MPHPIRALKTGEPTRREFHAAWSMPESERRWLIGIVWLASLWFACGPAMADPDLWGHTLYGLRAIDQGVLVERVDPFSYTAYGHEWINHEWLTEMQFGWLWRSSGSAGLWMWRNVMLLVVFGMGGVAIARSRASVAAALALLVFTAECLSEFVAFIRPQLATFALFAVTLTILRDFWDRRATKALWLLPPLTAVWTNLHGGFLSGLGLQALFAAACTLRAFKFMWDRLPACHRFKQFRQARSLSHDISSEPLRASRSRDARRAAVAMAAVFSLSLLATLLNPYGVQLHQMLWDHLIPHQAIREWQPLWGTRQAPTYYLPFLLAALALPWSRRWSWIDVLVLAVVGQQAVSHIRHIALFGIACLILLPGSLSESLSRLFRHTSRQLSGSGKMKYRLAAVMAVVCTLATLQIRGSWVLWEFGIAPWEIAVETTQDVPGVPATAVAVISHERLAGNIITDYGWAQYVLWHLHPQNRVAFDGRYRTVYPAPLESKFLEFERLSGSAALPAAILDEYPTEVALLPAKHSACAYLAGRADWVKLFSDDQAVIYVRDIPRFQELLARLRQGRIEVPRADTWQPFPAGPQLRDLDDRSKWLAGDRGVLRETTGDTMHTTGNSPTASPPSLAARSVQFQDP